MSSPLIERFDGRDPSTGSALSIMVGHDGRIAEVITGDHAAASHAPWLAPGLIDLQVNGFGGHDVNAAEPDPTEIAAITAALAERGITRWVPTIITASEDAITARIEAVVSARDADPVVRAAIPFVHVEGPFLSDRDGPRGVHDRDQIRPIDADEVARWAEHGPVGYITVSPHRPDSAEQIRRIVGAGIAVAVGHTHADVAAIGAAVDAGATLSTHLGNGIATTLPRHPNPIWTQLADDRLRCGLIADGHHLPPETVTTMVRAKRGRAFLVSDAVELAGTTPGIHRTSVGGEVELTVDGRLSHRGTDLLAGSGSELAACLRWLIAHTPFGLAEALELATAAPGRIVAELGGDPGGELRPGVPADVIELTDDGTVIGVIRGGRRLR